MKSWGETHKVKELVGQLIQSAGMPGGCWEAAVGASLRGDCVCASVSIVLSESRASAPCMHYCNGVT